MLQEVRSLWLICRKKKKNKAKEVLETVEKVEEKVEEKPKKGSTRTPAQQAYDKIQEKRVHTCMHYIIGSIWVV